MNKTQHNLNQQPNVIKEQTTLQNTNEDQTETNKT